MTGKEIEERKQTLTDKLKARAVNLERKKMEEIVVILVDTSGSMEEYCKDGNTKLGAVKKSIPYLQAKGSYVGYGLVGFGSTAYLIQQTTSNFSSILIQSDLLSSNGMTNIPSALQEGLKLFEEYIVEKRRMILMSDGDSNCDGHMMTPMIDACIKAGVLIDTIAFGDNADVNLLKSIAIKTGGIFQKVDSPLQLEAAYAALNFQVRYLEHKNGG